MAVSDNSKIEWTDASWNCVTGCTKVSPGCDHCYAETFAERWRGTAGHHFEQGFDITLRPERLTMPLRWTKPRRIFVNSMSDVFHEAVPTEFIAEMFAVMAACPQHTFQVLTKRHGRMRALLRGKRFVQDVRAAYVTLPSDQPAVGFPWPLPNVWLGVSAEDQQWYGIRVAALLGTPAAVRFISAEPLLGPIDLSLPRVPVPVHVQGIHWTIAGGESGPGARRCELSWLRSLRAQCVGSGIPFFCKQLGSVLGREVGAGSKGGDWDAWPADLRVREFPGESFPAAASA